MSNNNGYFTKLSKRISVHGVDQLKVCQNKRTFKTKRLARSWVKKWEDENYEKVTLMAVDGNHLVAYRCDVCHEFHLATKKFKESDL